MSAQTKGSPPTPFGLRAQIALVAALLSSLLVLAMVSIAWNEANASRAALGREHLTQHLAEVAQHITSDLEQSWVALGQLAKQPLVANALLDSEGRETYLQPFLERTRLPVGEGTTLTLTDFKGRTLTSSGGVATRATEALLAPVVNAARELVALERDAHGTRLLLAVPIVYSASGTIEGALLAEVDVERWLAELAHSLSTRSPLVRIELELQGTMVAATLDDTASGVANATQPLRMSPPLDGLEAKVSAWLPEAGYDAPLERLRNRLWMLGLLGVVGAVIASQWLAHVFARRVESLARAAKRIDAAGGHQQSLERLAKGRDEVAAVAGVIARLVRGLGDRQHQLERRLADAVRHLNRAQEVARTGSWIFDPATSRFECSREAGSLMALDRLNGLSPFALYRRILRDDRKAVRAAWRSGAELRTLNCEFRVGDGRKLRWLGVRAERDEGPGGSGERIIGTVQDISERKRSELEAGRAMVVFKHCAQGVMVTDGQGQILAVNPAFTRITGYTPAEACGRSPALLRSGRQGRAFYQQMWGQLARRGHWEGEIWNRRKSGEHYAQWLSINRVPDDQGRFGDFVALFSDITERKRQEEAAWRRASFDALTGLARQELFRDRLAGAIKIAAATRRELTVLCIDLDSLASVNSQLGHDAGDALLVEASQRLQRCLADESSLARRTGGEFLLLCEGQRTTPDIDALCKRILDELDMPFVLGGRRHEVAARIGYANYPHDANSVAELLNAAELALRSADSSGSSRSRRYSRELEAGELERRQVEFELHEAIANGAFALRYQPVIDARSGRIVSIEALLRWDHPRDGLIAPSDFFTSAERSGLLPELAMWAIPHAIAGAAQLRADRPRAFGLAINLRGLEVEPRELLATLESALAAGRFPPDSLSVEIPEAMLGADSDRSERLLTALHEAGVQLTIDDFGDTLASLNHLRRFPVSELKIERHLVAGCLHSDSVARAVAAIISMAEALGITVTAKGVENQAQADYLRRAGCHRLQGYFVSPPLAIEALEPLLDACLLASPTAAHHDTV